MATLIRALRKSDDRSAFRSGDVALDDFFARHAGQNQFKFCASVTYVAAREGRIAGFVTVTAATLGAAELPPDDRLRYPYPLPVLSLGRLATDERDRGLGVGADLLRHVLVLAVKMSDEIGCVGVVVDSKAGALGFYAKYGFKSRPTVEAEPDAPTPMFLKISTIRRGLSVV